MTEKDEPLRQITERDFLEKIKERKIKDYDSGLLQTIFEDITGSPDYVFNKWCERLVRLGARIKNLVEEKDDDPEILEKIKAFFEKEKLPSITTSVDDYKQSKGRIIDVRTDGDSFTCTVDIYPAIEKSLREEHYLKLTDKVRWLVLESIAKLDEKELAWHRKEIAEIKFTLDVDDGKPT